jgi:hypothetical protein
MQPQPPQHPNDPPELPTSPTLPALLPPPMIPPHPYPLILQPPTHQEPPQRRKPPRRRIGTPMRIVGFGALLLVSALCSGTGLALERSIGTVPLLKNGGAADTATATTDMATDVSATATTVEPTATIRAQPTKTLHPQPTGTPSPHPTNTATPTNTPCADPCNPWGYNFDPTGGSLITSPPSAFCSYFACIGSPPGYTSFWSGQGYVIECQDTLFSKTGGIKSSCSQHGGELRTLYAH